MGKFPSTFPDDCPESAESVSATIYHGCEGEVATDEDFTPYAMSSDPAKQKQVFGQWISFITDETWVFPWSNTVPRAATTAKVQGLTYNMTEFLMPNEAWLAA